MTKAFLGRVLAVTLALCLAACVSPRPPVSAYPYYCKDPAEAMHLKAQSAHQQANLMEQEIQAAKGRLNKGDVYKNGACVKPAMRELPPRPKMDMTEEETYRQAAAACVDLTARRHSAQLVMEALASSRQEAYWAEYERWRKQGNKASCAMVNRSQLEDWIADKICGIGGKMGRFACLQTLIDQCVSEAVQSCNARLIAWENKVTAIKLEPESRQQQCQNDLETIATYEKKIPMLRMEAQINREEHQKLMTAMPDPRDRMASIDPRCDL